jgi:glutathione S-transferase
MIDLYTSPTPNGHKASVTLEELELPYKATAIDLSKNVQKEEWFLALNPNGRILVIVDRDADDLAPSTTAWATCGSTLPARVAAPAARRKSRRLTAVVLGWGTKRLPGSLAMIEDPRLGALGVDIDSA